MPGSRRVSLESTTRLAESLTDETEGHLRGGEDGIGSSTSGLVRARGKDMGLLVLGAMEEEEREERRERGSTASP